VVEQPKEWGTNIGYGMWEVEIRIHSKCEWYFRKNFTCYKLWECIFGHFCYVTKVVDCSIRVVDYSIRVLRSFLASTSSKSGGRGGMDPCLHRLWHCKEIFYNQKLIHFHNSIDKEIPPHSQWIIKPCTL